MGKMLSLLAVLMGSSMALADVGGSCLSRYDKVVISHTGQPPFGRMRTYETAISFQAGTASFKIDTNYSTTGVSTPTSLSYSEETLSRTKLEENFVFPGAVSNVSSVYSEGQTFVGRLLATINQLSQTATMLLGNASDQQVAKSAIECAIFRLAQIQQKAVTDVLRFQNIKMR